MEKEPLVSVIIPTYKGSETLERAINSVLNQSYNNTEIIIVDDNDKNSKQRRKTERLMRNFDQNNIIYINHEYNKNGAAARNTGIKNAKGKYIAFLDDDDEWLPQKVELQVNKLEKLNKEWGGIYSGFIRKKNGEIVSKSNELIEGNFKKELLLMRFDIAGSSNLFLRRSVLEELEGFDESFNRHQDWEILIRFFRDYKLAAIQDKLLIKHLTSQNKPNAEERSTLKRKYLKKFRTDIEKFPEETQKKINRKHWLRVAKHYFREYNFRKGYSSYKKSQNYSESEQKEKLLVILIIEVIDSFIPIKDISKINNIMNSLQN